MSWLTMALALGVSLALAGMWAIGLVNAAIFPRLRSAPRGRDGAEEDGANLPHLSVLIPARNEARVIGDAVTTLLAQDYPHFDLHILDDGSDDDTARLAQAAGQGDPRLHIHSGIPLPRGWLGKNWACHQLAQQGEGDLLLFTDADVQWQPGALCAAVAEAQRTQADLLTIWPVQITESWGERLVVPLMTLVVIGYLPLPLVHHSPWRLFAAANGQGLLFRRDAYARIQGHTCVRDQVLEDVSLARQAKGAGLRLRMVDGADFVRCRMYRNWPEVFDGYAKNILAGYGNRVEVLVLATLFHWAVFLWPWYWLVAGGGGPGWPLGLILAGLGIRALAAAVMHQRTQDALFLPLSVLLLTAIAARSIWWHLHYGGPLWKGRIVRRER